jgi:hypothetical protein
LFEQAGAAAPQEAGRVGQTNVHHHHRAQDTDRERPVATKLHGQLKRVILKNRAYIRIWFDRFTLNFNFNLLVVADESLAMLSRLARSLSPRRMSTWGDR